MSPEACVPPELDGARLDVAVAGLFPSITRSQAGRLIESGRVTLAGSTSARPSSRVKAGQSIDVALPEPVPTAIAPEPISLAVVYEDDDVAVVDKPAGMVVHPAPGHPSGTLVNAALSRFGALPSPGGASRSGIVHRLDRDTSGLLVIAKTEAALVDLQRQFKARRVEKSYLALVRGHPSLAGTIDWPIGRDPRDRKRMAVTASGRQALTSYTTLARYRRHALLRVALMTGRTHQIRVHMAALGTPVAGDRVYGGDAPGGLARQFLHAQRLGFDLPGSRSRLVCTSALPSNLVEVLSKAGEHEPSRWAGVTGYALETRSGGSPADELREPDSEEIQEGEDDGEDDG